MLFQYLLLKVQKDGEKKSRNIWDLSLSDNLDLKLKTKI